MRKIASGLLVGLVLSTCAFAEEDAWGSTLSSATKPAIDFGGCSSNFSASGSIFSGKQFKTFAVLSEVDVQTAFRKANAVVRKNEYEITSSDEKSGTISAAQRTSADRLLPLELKIESVSGVGTKIEFSFSIPSGVMASEGGIRNEFCNLASAVANKVEPDVVKVDSTKPDSDKNEGGLFKAISGVLNPQNETVKVEGLMAANQHTLCKTHKEKMGGNGSRSHVLAK